MMGRIRAVVLFFLVFTASARAEEPKALNLRIEPHFLVITEAVADLQFRVGNHFSLGPTFSYMWRGPGIYAGWKVADRAFYDDHTERTGLGLRAAWYLQGVDVHSFYVAPFGKVIWNKVESHYSGFLFSSPEPDRTGEFTEIDAGISVGWQWILKTLSFNVGLGVARYWHPVSLRFADANGANAYDMRLQEDKLGLQIDAGIGFRF